ncbi:hypothetical protein K523DRAFT_21832 [Schizophyllum commune Tattone D]|nr:hypothetical protein K523DRAFT_21832 [Schizophyllum commune Tattone D]
MSNYDHHGSSNAPYPPALAQNPRMVINGQAYYYPTPYHVTAHTQHVARTTGQGTGPLYTVIQRQQVYAPAIRPATQGVHARDRDHGAPNTFAAGQAGQRISTPLGPAPPSPRSDSSSSSFSSSSSSASSPSPGRLYNYNPMLHSCRPWEMPWRTSIPPRSASDGSYISHISDLPPEVLSQIFLHTVPLHLYDARPHTRAEPLVISHVCRLWRDISINLPGLWATLCLTGCPNKHEHRRIKLVKVFMDRARGTGMSICYQDAEAEGAIFHEWEIVMHRRGFGMAPAHDRCYCTLDLLISRIAEVRVLQLYIGHASSVRLGSLPLGAATMLQDIRVLFMENGEEVQALARLYASLTGLKHFGWGSYLDAFVMPVPVSVPWEHLISVRLETSVPHDAFLDLMASGQHLEDVFLRLCRSAQQGNRRSTRIRQTALERLIVCGDEPLDYVLNTLQVPALRRLALQTSSSRTYTWPFARVKSFRLFLSGILPGLDSLTLEADECVREADLLSILALPQIYVVKDLELRIPLISDTFFDRLCPEHRPPLVPHLKELRVGCCVTVDGKIADMIMSRLRHGYPLRYFKVAFASHQVGRHTKDTKALRYAAKYDIFTVVTYSAGADRADA